MLASIPFSVEAMSQNSLTALVVFAAAGLVIAWLNHRLRRAEAAQRTTAATAIARAERLDAILNTTVDGIIVIDARGTIEAFNRGAQELFGYPALAIVCFLLAAAGAVALFVTIVADGRRRRRG